METEFYDEEIEEIPNEQTLHAMAQTKKIAEFWLNLKSRKRSKSSEQNFEMICYDDLEEIPNETTLRAMREADEILDAWEKFHSDETNSESL